MPVVVVIVPARAATTRIDEKRPLMIRMSLVMIVLAGCSATNSGDASKPSNLNVAYCQKIADETARAGKLNYNLCPGYMPDGYPVEIQ